MEGTENGPQIWRENLTDAQRNAMPTDYLGYRPERVGWPDDMNDWATMYCLQATDKTVAAVDEISNMTMQMRSNNDTYL